jgi:hypothetical protein
MIQSDDAPIVRGLLAVFQMLISLLSPRRKFGIKLIMNTDRKASLDRFYGFTRQSGLKNFANEPTNSAWSFKLR